MTRPERIVILSQDALYDIRMVRGAAVVHGVTHAALPDTLYDDPDAAQTAAALLGVLAGDPADAAPRGVGLVLPQQWVFTHALDGLARRANAAERAFALEEHLPVPLEEVTVVTAPSSGGPIGVAVPTQPMRSLLDRLADAGFTVTHVTTDVLSLMLHAPDRAVVVTDLRWSRTAVRHPETGQWDIAVGPPQQPSDTGYDLRNGSPSTEPVPAEHRAALQIAKAARASRAALTLLSGTLASASDHGRRARQITRCLILAVLTLLTWSLWLTTALRAERRALTDLADQQHHCYRLVFGNTPALPPGADLRLASERVRLQGLTVNEDAPLEIPAPLDSFRTWVAALPPDLRLQLHTVQLDARQWTLRGRTRTHRDAERIADALQRVPGIQPRPPRTSRLADGGVEFSILARVAP